MRSATYRSSSPSPPSLLPIHFWKDSKILSHIHLLESQEHKAIFVAEAEIAPFHNRGEEREGDEMTFLRDCRVFEWTWRCLVRPMVKESRELY